MLRNDFPFYSLFDNRLDQPFWPNDASFCFCNCRSDRATGLLVTKSRTCRGINDWDGAYRLPEGIPMIILLEGSDVVGPPLAFEARFHGLRLSLFDWQ
jgi:hypothetical protein